MDALGNENIARLVELEINGTCLFLLVNINVLAFHFPQIFHTVKLVKMKMYRNYLKLLNAPVAQVDRAQDS